MTKRSLLLAAAVAALMSFGTAARADFVVTSTVNAAPVPAGLTFSPSSVTLTSSTLTGFNFVNITFDTTTRNVSNFNFTLSGNLSVLNTATNTTSVGTYSANFRYNVDAVGQGSLILLNNPFTFPTSVGGVFFSFPGYASPTIQQGSTVPSTTGNLSINVQAVPEPASVAMVGLGLAGLGGLALRRRSAK